MDGHKKFRGATGATRQAHSFVREFLPQKRNQKKRKSKKSHSDLTSRVNMKALRKANRFDVG